MRGAVRHFWSILCLVKGFEAQLTVTGVFQVAICVRNKNYYSSNKRGRRLARPFEAGRRDCVSFLFCFPQLAIMLLTGKAERVEDRPLEGLG